MSEATCLSGKSYLYQYLCIIFLVITVATSNTFALPGSGIKSDPYRIESLANFDEFAAGSNYWSDYIRLDCNIDLSGRIYTKAVIAPNMGTADYFQGTAFTGVFDGNGHKIDNLKIEGGHYLGLFGYIGSGGSFENLGVEDVNITSTGYYIGGLVGRGYSGNVTKCYASGAVRGAGSVGGLVGSISLGSVTNSYSTCAVTGNYSVGGLMGFHGTATIVTNCYATGAVNGGTYTGGLVGYTAGKCVTNCYATGTVTSDGNSVGGLLGEIDCPVAVTNCYATGAVSGNKYVGGLAGHSSSCSKVTNCYAAGAVSGNFNVGGLVGYSYSQNDVNASFWDINTSGWTISSGGTGKTTIDMKRKDTFTSWDFVEIWGIEDNQTYPFLKLTYPVGDLNLDKKIDFIDFVIFANHWLEGVE
jgi:hypothetical protein